MSLDYDKLNEMYSVVEQFGRKSKSFYSKDGVLRDEFYKTEDRPFFAQKMEISSWEESSFGSGTIKEKVLSAANKKGNNLVSWQNLSDIKNLPTEKTEAIDRAFFHLFRGNDDEEAFGEIVNAIGGRYDVIAFLFYVKSYDGNSDYLPVRPSVFDEIFASLGVADFQMARFCSWENYQRYLSLIDKVCAFLRGKRENEDISRLAAHSFLWVAHYLTAQVEKAEEDADHELENDVNKRIATASKKFAEDLMPKEVPGSVIRNGIKTFKRDPAIAAQALVKAGFRCECDPEHIDFIRRSNGENYTEAHHLVPMAAQAQFPYSLDTLPNIVSLCSRCHNLLHHGTEDEIRAVLLPLFDKRKDSMKEVGIDLTEEELLKLYR